VIDVNAQRENSDSLKVIYSYTDTVSKIEIIPRDALNGCFDGLIIKYKLTLPSNFGLDSLLKVDFPSINKSAFEPELEIKWNAQSIDGRYILVINPKQIYLKSSHDNPNPKYLFWLSDIDSSHYRLIKQFLTNNNQADYFDNGGDGFSYLCSICENEEFLNDSWIDLRYDNFSKILKILNLQLIEKDQLILIPNFEKFQDITPLQIAYNVEDIKKNKQKNLSLETIVDSERTLFHKIDIMSRFYWDTLILNIIPNSQIIINHDSEFRLYWDTLLVGDKIVFEYEKIHKQFHVTSGSSSERVIFEIDSTFEKFDFEDVELEAIKCIMDIGCHDDWWKFEDYSVTNGKISGVKSANGDWHIKVDINNGKVDSKYYYEIKFEETFKDW
jgi:hypothetical protein